MNRLTNGQFPHDSGIRLASCFNEFIVINPFAISSHFHSNEKAIKRLLWFKASFTLIRFQLGEKKRREKIQTRLSPFEAKTIQFDVTVFKPNNPSISFRRTNQAITPTDFSQPRWSEWKLSHGEIFPRRHSSMAKALACHAGGWGSNRDKSKEDFFCLETTICSDLFLNPLPSEIQSPALVFLVIIYLYRRVPVVSYWLRVALNCLLHVFKLRRVF